MSSADMGGPAFPMASERFPDGTLNAERWEGMTLRDYFAAHAPKPPADWKAMTDPAENIIVWRWTYADAMLEARNK